MSQDEYTAFDLLIGVIAILIALFAVFVAPRITKDRKAKRVVVAEFQTGLLIRKGKVERQLGPGEYSTWLTTNTIELYDLREQSMQLANQEMLTKDLMPVKVSLILRYRLTDPKLHRSAHSYPASRMYEEVQIELRKRVALVPLDDLLADRDKMMAGFAEAVSPPVRAVGMEMLKVELRDLIPAGAAKTAFADIWKAQKEGQAALERARSEQASLRLLANAARMLKGNPELMNLRLLQTVGGKNGPTVVLGGGAGLLPVSATPDSGGDDA